MTDYSLSRGEDKCGLLCSVTGARCKHVDRTTNTCADVNTVDAEGKKVHHNFINGSVLPDHSTPSVHEVLVFGSQDSVGDSESVEEKAREFDS